MVPPPPPGAFAETDVTVIQTIADRDHGHRVAEMSESRLFPTAIIAAAGASSAVAVMPPLAGLPL